MKKTLVLVLMLALLGTILPAISSPAKVNATAQGGNLTDTLVGAIRWDAWIGGASGPGYEVERSLGPNKYHDRLPFYAVETGTDSVEVRMNTQAKMDSEIAYAKNMGLDYWAYVFYTDGSGLDQALDLHLSSTHEEDMKWCYIIEQSRLNATTIPGIVTRMQRSSYQTVNSGQPLVYLIGSSGWTAQQIADLRTAATNAGLSSLYIVYMSSTASDASTMCTTLSCQAISAYNMTGQDGQTYASFAAQEKTKWNAWQSTGQKVIPFVSTGWDPRPRIDNPVSWTTYASNSWVQTATPNEIANHLSDGLDWVNNNQSVNEANAIIMYAWNEFDEGGWICPTLYNGTDRADAIRNVLNGVVTNDGFENSTTGWSSQAASIYTNSLSIPTNAYTNVISNSGFESGTTSWSAQNCTLAADSANARTGAYACLASNRAYYWGSPYQNIKNTLLTYGQGYYLESAWAKFASGSNTAYIVVKTNDTSGDHYFTSSSVTLGTSYMQITGTLNISWTGTLNSAVMYVQTPSVTTNLYLDDFTFSYQDRLLNPGFETGTTSWSAQSCSIAADSANAKTGSYACAVTSRTATSGSPKQDVKVFLQNFGQGYYNSSVWAKFASGSENINMYLKLNDSNGDHWISLGSAIVGTSYSQILGLTNITWTGTLNSAIIYIQSYSSTASMYLDDFSFLPQNLLSNPGFDVYTTSWGTQACTIAADTANKRTGVNSCSVTARTLVSSSPTQDIKTLLLNNGQGSYTSSVWAKLASGTDNAYIVIKTNDSNGDHIFYGTAGALSTAYAQLTGTMDITWTGTLNSAIMYIETATVTTSMYLDDFSLLAPPANNGASYCIVTGRTAVTGSPAQDIKTRLLTQGQGLYDYSVYAKLVQGSDTLQVTVKTNDTNGDHYFSGTAANVGMSFTSVGGELNITWNGTLNSATLYVQTASSTANLFLDDFKLFMPPFTTPATIYNYLANPGFEDGTTTWLAQNSIIGVDTANVNSGTKACAVSGRSDYNGSPVQDIKASLSAYGQGIYTAGVWAKFASGSSNVNLAVKTNDSNGDHYFAGSSVNVGTTYTQVISTLNITWTGTLNSAILYIQTPSVTTDIYLDDFVFTLQNRLINPGFESGTASWSAQGCTLSADTGNARTGTYACLASGRASYWGSPVQDIKATLQNYGQGSYTGSTYVKFASGSDSAYIVVKTNDDNGNHWLTCGYTTVGTTYTQLTGTMNITWTGTLNSAVIYVQNTASTANLYIDDFAFYK